jgi:hypothetical protein
MKENDAAPEYRSADGDGVRQAKKLPETKF